jgi:PAS domain S-box-containing protein
LTGGKFNLTQKGLILVAIPLLIELIFFASLVFLLNETERERNEAEHARQLISEADALLAVFYNSISELVPAGLGSSEGSDQKDFESKQEAIRAEYRHLISLGSTPKEVAEITALGGMVEHGIKVIEDVHHLLGQFGRDLGSFSQLHKRRKQIVKLVREIKEQIGVLIGPEMELAQSGSERARQNADLFKGIIYAGIVGNILLALLGWRYFSHHIVRRLDILHENSRKIAIGEALPDAVPGGDEIADLDIALHQMAEALNEAAEVERALTDNVSDVICSLDANNRFVALNPACLQLWGYSREDLLGMNVREITSAEDADKMIGNLSTKGRSENKNFETRIKLKNGEEADMHWTANWSPKQQSYFCVVHDISAEKQIERMKKEFVAMVSHDLRTPLNSVLNLLTLMSVEAYGAVNETGHKRLDAAEKDIGRLIGLINELLDLEKLESGEIALELKSCSAESLMEHAEQSVYGFAQQNAVTVKHDACDLALSVDRNRIVQVLINLLSNAIKFSDPESEVKMRAERGSNYTVFEISDSGCGIPPELQSTIFERFKQAKGANIKHTGTGLGLAICKNIVEQHGGSIGVDSELGVGSTFWVKIPDRET